MTKTLALSLLAAGLVGCSTLSPKKLVLEREWARSTLKTENWGFRHSERTAPLIEGDTVYQGNGLDGVVAYNTDSGFTKWRFDVRNGVESGFASDERNLFFGASDGNFYALNKITGRIAWTFPTRVETLGPPLLHNGVIYFLAGNNVLYALDSKTGKQLWNYNRGEVSSLSIRGAARPAIYGKTLYAGFSDGYLAALNAGDGSMLWERKLATTLKFFDVDSGPVVDESFIWVSSYDGALYCLSRTDGQVQWRVDEGGWVPVTIDGDNLYYPALNHTVYALNKKTGKQIWAFNFDERMGIPTQIQLHKGLLLFGTSDGALFAVDQNKGTAVSSFVPGAGISATPGLKNQNIYLYTNQANLYKLSLKWMTDRQEELQWKN